VRRVWYNRGDLDSLLEQTARDTSWAWARAWRERVTQAEELLNNTAAPQDSVHDTGLRARAALILAFEAGDISTARARIREDLIVARGMLAAFGWKPWQTISPAFEALRLHEKLAVVTGDSLAASQARNLISRLRVYAFAQPIYALGFSPVLMSDPDVPPAARFLASGRGLSPGVRRSLALAAVLGQCYNGREMLFGMSPMRRELIGRVRRAVGDLPIVVAQLDSLSVEAESTMTAKPGLLGLLGRWTRFCADHT
jgi:hypothetical protein